MGDEITLRYTVMVVDDSIFILNVVQAMLKNLYNIMLAQSAEIAFHILENQPPDLILLDLEMPDVDGFEFLEKLKGVPEWSDIPVIFLTGASDRGKEEKALNLGAVDYILKPISEGVLKKRISMHMKLYSYQHDLESLVKIKTTQLEKTQDLILDVLANVTTHRDNDTGAHIVRTTNYVKLIVERMLYVKRPDYCIDDAYARDIIKSARLHDIGKIGISDEILRKTSTLTAHEYETIKMHTVLGAEMLDESISKLEPGDAGFLLAAREIILHHHEWWDGTGYPHKLAGPNIPISARIMAIADVYDALISKRAYKEPFSHREAVDVLINEAGTHFDPHLLQISAPLFNEFSKVASTYKDNAI